MTTQTMKPSDYVRRGWCQNIAALDSEGHRVFYADPDRKVNLSEIRQRAAKVCLTTAVLLIYENDSPRTIDIAHKINAQLGLAPEDRYGMIDWNNAPERTQVDVVALLEAIGE